MSFFGSWLRDIYVHAFSSFSSQPAKPSVLFVHRSTALFLRATFRTTLLLRLSQIGDTVARSLFMLCACFEDAWDLHAVAQQCRPSWRV